MSIGSDEVGRGAHWRTRSQAIAAPALGPVRFVPIGEDARVPVPLCNNEGQIVFESGGLRVGLFRAVPGQANFRFSGLPGEHIVVFQKGAVRVQRLGGGAYLADPITVHFLDPDSIYFRDGLAEHSDSATWVGIDAPLLAELLGTGSAAERLSWPFQIAPTEGETYLLQSELVAAIEERRASAAVLERATLLLARRAIAEARRFAARGSGGRLDTCRLAERARVLLGAELAAARSVAELAAELGCSRSHLGRVLRRHVGASPHQYRLQLRLRRALVALAEGASDLSDLALACGFASHSHFTCSFRAVFGVTPSSLRRRPAGERLGELVERLERASD